MKQLYNGILIRGYEKLAFIVNASNPDEVTELVSQWPSMLNYDIRFLRISTDIDKSHWTDNDISMILCGDSEGIWGRCTS